MVAGGRNEQMVLSHFILYTLYYIRVQIQIIFCRVILEGKINISEHLNKR